MEENNMKLAYEKFRMLKNSIRNQQDYVIQGWVEKYFDRIIENASYKEVLEGEKVFRARIHGFEPADDKEYYTPPIKPYSKFEISMPPKHVIISEGRANPNNVRFFYTASNLETACAEVRPYCNQWVSVASFSAKKKITTIELSHSCNFSNIGDEDEVINCFYILLSNEFRQPVSDLRKEMDYVLTQLFTRFVQEKGFEGISFVSSLMNRNDSKNMNLVFFTDTYFKFIDSRLVYIDGLKIQNDIRYLP